MQTREDRVYVLEGNANILEEKKQGLNLTFDITEVSKGTALELPYFFYQGYTVVLKVGGEEVYLKTTESDSGFVMITLPKEIEQGTITLTYTGTNIEKTAYAISLISLIGFAGYIIYFKKNMRQEESNER